MGLTSQINAVAGRVIGQFCGSDRAEYQTASGDIALVQFIRFDPFVSDQMAGMNSINENESVLVLATEVWAPERDDKIRFPDGSEWSVRMIEPHRQRGYFKLGLSQVEQ